MISQQMHAGPYATGPDGKGLIPTCDGAGEIVAVGDGASGWKNGDRVHSTYYEDWLTGPIKVICSKRYAYKCKTSLTLYTRYICRLSIL
jgi:NADPH:quinone reductase-like Zn-dependent oxidoreductase